MSNKCSCGIPRFSNLLEKQKLVCKIRCHKLPKITNLVTFRVSSISRLLIFRGPLLSRCRFFRGAQTVVTSCPSRTQNRFCLHIREPECRGQDHRNTDVRGVRTFAVGGRKEIGKSKRFHQAEKTEC